jgi:hypothetical protein
MITSEINEPRLNYLEKREKGYDDVYDDVTKKTEEDVSNATKYSRLDDELVKDSSSQVKFDPELKAFHYDPKVVGEFECHLLD